MLATLSRYGDSRLFCHTEFMWNQFRWIDKIKNWPPIWQFLNTWVNVNRLVWRNFCKNEFPQFLHCAAATIIKTGIAIAIKKSVSFLWWGSFVKSMRSKMRSSTASTTNHDSFIRSEHCGPMGQDNDVTFANPWYLQKKGKKRKQLQCKILKIA